MKKKTLFAIAIITFISSLFILNPHSAFAGTATLTWNANTEADLSGYKIYYGTVSRTGTTPCANAGYTSSINVGNVLTYTFNNLTDGVTYYFAVSAYDTSNNESACSIQQSKVIPAVDVTAPSVSITAPTAGSTVSGSSVAVSANASDNVGVVGVQFKIDGTNLGTEDTSSPYSITWNTTSASNGSHTLTATARDAAGNQTTSSGVTVNVNNTTLTADFNSDAKVNSVDFGIMMSYWSNTTMPAADINKDGTVNSVDLGIMMSQWTS